MTDDATQEFLREGLPTYAAALRAVETFEDALGSLCERVVDNVLQDTDAFETVGKATHKSWRNSSTPWIAGWAPLSHGEHDWQLWLTVYWNEDGDLEKTRMDVYVYGAAPEVAARAEAGKPDDIQIHKEYGSHHYSRPIRAGDPLEERMQHLTATVLDLHLRAIAGE